MGLLFPEYGQQAKANHKNSEIVQSSRKHHQINFFLDQSESYIFNQSSNENSDSEARRNSNHYRHGSGGNANPRGKIS
jgi:hypothetical protein